MKKAFQNLLRNYFNFTNGEKNAFFVMCLIIIVISIFPYLSFVNRKSELVDFSLINQLEAQHNKDSASKNYENESDNFHDYPEKKSFSNKFIFNPNTASLNELESLGFKEYLAKRIIKFRNAGGKFYIKSDIKKVYGITPSFAEELMPYIDLPESRSEPSFQKNTDYKHRPNYVQQLIDINTTDTLALNRLKGIGHKLSQRIITFRDKLGGFYSLGQLNEVYGLNPELVTEIMPKFNPKLSPVKLLNVNYASVEELGNHPYIKKKLAEVIVNYRTQHGPFGSIEDVLKIKVLDENTWMKLKNYLRV